MGIDGEGTGTKQDDSGSHDDHVEGQVIAGDCTAVECGKPGKPCAGHDQEGNERNDRDKKASQQRQSAKEREYAHRHDGCPQVLELGEEAGMEDKRRSNCHTQQEQCNPWSAARKSGVDSR